MRTKARPITLASAAALLCLVAGAASAASPEDKCEAAKHKITGKYAFCRQKAEAKAISKGGAPDYTKCDEKLAEQWAKAEEKAAGSGASCVDSLTSVEMQTFVTSHSDSVAAALDGDGLPSCGVGVTATGQTTARGAGSDGDIQAGIALSFVDNGDGTITDNNTGLMWEKKNDTFGGVHYRGNDYTWTTGTNDLDGTVVTEFLDVLNDVAGGGASCFAGYCDWRLPNIRELETITNYGAPDPGVDPAFHQPATCTSCSDLTLPSCSCTSVTSTYLSSTTYSYSESEVWGVGSGRFGVPKTFPLVARAVRGGL